MKSKEEIVEILIDELCYIYCFNCKDQHLDDGDKNYRCDDCHRKYMMWGISKKCAEKIADRIYK